MAKLTGRQIWEIRNKITSGYSIATLAKEYKVSSTTISNYTKSERRK